MTLREQIMQALADIPGTNNWLWQTRERPLHMFRYGSRLCVFAEGDAFATSNFQAFLCQFAEQGAFVRFITDAETLKRALQTLKRITPKTHRACPSKITSSAPCPGSRSTAATS